MQAKQLSFVSKSDRSTSSSRRWTVVLVPLAAAFAFGWATQPSAQARTAPAPLASARSVPDVAPETTITHFADADKDIGPGEAESMVARHP